MTSQDCKAERDKPIYKILFAIKNSCRHGVLGQTLRERYPSVDSTTLLYANPTWIMGLALEAVNKEKICAKKHFTKVRI